MKLTVIIPVYNEAATFATLLGRVVSVKPNMPKEILVIEGGSTDGTAEITESYNGRSYRDGSTITVFHVTEDIGKGYKVRYGLKKATGDIILIQDADLEYDPRDYHDLLQPILHGKARFVLGSRHLKQQTWKIRQFANIKHSHVLNGGDAMLKRIFGFLFGHYLTDPNTMYKVFRRDCLEGIKLRGNKFDLDLELVIKLLKKGIVPVEVPVSYKGRSYEEGKKIRPIRDGWRALVTMLRYKFFN